MSIYAIQGTPGSGKSAVMVADMAEFLLSGGVVAMNFSLTSGWLDLICNSSFRYRSGRVDRDLYRRSVYDRCWKIGTHDTIMDLGKRLHSMTKLQGRERVGRLYLDESQFLFNSRDWEKNKGFIEFFTQHRKLGWDVFLITHTLDMIDKQIRGLVELETRLRNLQNVKLFGVLPIAWKPTFVAITRYAGISAGAGEIFSRRLYPLSPAYKDVYDTCEVFAFDSASKKSAPHGDYTPPVERVSLFQRLLEKILVLTSPPEIKKNFSRVPKSPVKFVPYWEHIIPGVAPGPGPGVAPSIKGLPYSQW